MNLIIHSNYIDYFLIDPIMISSILNPDFQESFPDLCRDSTLKMILIL